MHKYKKVHDIETDKELFSKMNTEFGSKIAKILYVSALSEEQEFKT